MVDEGNPDSPENETSADDRADLKLGSGAKSEFVQSFEFNPEDAPKAKSPSEIAALKNYLLEAEVADAQDTQGFEETGILELAGRFIGGLQTNLAGQSWDLLLSETNDAYDFATFRWVVTDSTYFNVVLLKITNTSEDRVREQLSQIFRSSLSFQNDQMYAAPTYLLMCADATNPDVVAIWQRIELDEIGVELPDFTLIRPRKAWSLIQPPEKNVSGNDDTRSATPPSARMVSDAAIENPEADILQFGPYADAIFGLIDHPDTKPPLTLAINAKWGMGKTSLARLVEHKLCNKPGGWNAAEERQENPHTTYWFNAWMHDEADKLAAAFMADVMRECHRKLPLWQQLWRPLPDGVCGKEAQMRRRAVLIGFGLLAVGWAAMQVIVTGSAGDTDGELGGLVALLQQTESKILGTGGLTIAAIMANFAKLRETGKTIGAYIGAPAKESNIGSLGTVRDQLREMIRRVTPQGSKFVVFIDDLERCRSTHAVDVLEVVNQLLAFDPVVTVVVADMPAVATCVEIKYKDLAEKYDPGQEAHANPDHEGDSGKRTYGRLFLQKFIQLQFNLPRTTKEELSEFVKKISGLAEEDSSADQSKTGNSSRIVKWLGSIWTGIEGSSVAAWQTAEDRGSVFPPWMTRSGVPVAIVLVMLFWPLLFASWLQRLGLRIAGATMLRRSGAFRLAVQFLVVAWQLIYLVGVIVSFLAFGYAAAADFAGAPGAMNRVISEMLQATRPLSMELNYVLTTAILMLLLPVVWIASQLEERQRARAWANARAAGTDIDPTNEESLADYRERLAGMEESEQDAFIREISQRKLSDESEWFKGARQEALAELVLPPRNVKRLINRLRLLLFVLNARGLLHRDDGLTPEVVGKWIALQEIWPELAAIIRHDPMTAGRLEECTTNDSWCALMKQLVPLYENDLTLRGFFQGEPKLGPVSMILTAFSRPSGSVGGEAA